METPLCQHFFYPDSDPNHLSSSHPVATDLLLLHKETFLMAKRILLDMDGVMADVYQNLINLEYRNSGRRISYRDLEGNNVLTYFPNLSEMLHQKGFFRNLPLMAGAQEGTEYLNNKYDLYIVTAAVKLPDSMIEKYEWLQENFPYIRPQQMVFCGSKIPVCGDIMIDDHPKNLYPFCGERILFTQPNNIHMDFPDFVRINSWKDIDTLL